MKRELLTATGLGSVAFFMSITTQAQTFNWSGSYVGVELGAAINELSKATPLFTTNSPLTPVSTTGPFGALPGQVDLGKVSPIGGVTFGYNKQFGALVVGVETDFSGLGSRAHYQTQALSSPVDNIGTVGARATTFSASTGTDWLYTFRPRIGFAVDRLMVFGTGGYALGGTHLGTSLAVDENFTDPGKAGQTTAGTQRSFGSSSIPRSGFVAGGGVEYALTDRLTLKSEALYYNLGTGQVAGIGTSGFSRSGAFTPASAGASGAQPYIVRQQFDGVIARFGLNYKLP